MAFGCRTICIKAQIASTSAGVLAGIITRVASKIAEG